VKQIIMPEGNKPDWQDVPAEVRAKLKVHFVRQISEVLDLALVAQ
jgi:ATP-dependent Lon protease